METRWYVFMCVYFQTHNDWMSYKSKTKCRIEPQYYDSMASIYHGKKIKQRKYENPNQCLT